MKSTNYKFLLWQLIGALDTGKYDELSYDEVHQHAEAGTIKLFLTEHFGSDIDLSLIPPQDWPAITEEWASLANGAEFNVENKGMCLLLAYALQGLQASLPEAK